MQKVQLLRAPNPETWTSKVNKPDGVPKRKNTLFDTLCKKKKINTVTEEPVSSENKYTSK